MQGSQGVPALLQSIVIIIILFVIITSDKQAEIQLKQDDRSYKSEPNHYCQRHTAPNNR
jgi:hypothetical protein